MRVAAAGTVDAAFISVVALCVVGTLCVAAFAALLVGRRRTLQLQSLPHALSGGHGGLPRLQSTNRQGGSTDLDAPHAARGAAPENSHLDFGWAAASAGLPRTSCLGALYQPGGAPSSGCLHSGHVPGCLVSTSGVRSLVAARHAVDRCVHSLRRASSLLTCDGGDSGGGSDSGDSSSAWDAGAAAVAHGASAAGRSAGRSACRSALVARQSNSLCATAVSAEECGALPAPEGRVQPRRRASRLFSDCGSAADPAPSVHSAPQAAPIKTAPPWPPAHSIQHVLSGLGSPPWAPSLSVMDSNAPGWPGRSSLPAPPPAPPTPPPAAPMPPTYRHEDDEDVRVPHGDAPTRASFFSCLFGSATKPPVEVAVPGHESKLSDQHQQDVLRGYTTAAAKGPVRGAMKKAGSMKVVPVGTDDDSFEDDDAVHTAPKAPWTNTANGDKTPKEAADTQRSKSVPLGAKGAGGGGEDEDGRRAGKRGGRRAMFALSADEAEEDDRPAAGAAAAPAAKAAPRRAMFADEADEEDRPAAVKSAPAVRRAMFADDAEDEERGGGSAKGATNNAASQRAASAREDTSGRPSGRPQIQMASAPPTTMNSNASSPRQQNGGGGGMTQSSSTDRISQNSSQDRESNSPATGTNLRGFGDASVRNSRRNTVRPAPLDEPLWNSPSPGAALVSPRNTSEKMSSRRGSSEMLDSQGGSGAMSAMFKSSQNGSTGNLRQAGSGGGGGGGGGGGQMGGQMSALAQKATGAAAVAHNRYASSGSTFNALQNLTFADGQAPSPPPPELQPTYGRRSQNGTASQNNHHNEARRSSYTAADDTGGPMSAGSGYSSASSAPSKNTRRSWQDEAVDYPGGGGGDFQSPEPDMYTKSYSYGQEEGEDDWRRGGQADDAPRGSQMASGNNKPRPMAYNNPIGTGGRGGGNARGSNVGTRL